MTIFSTLLIAGGSSSVYAGTENATAVDKNAAHHSGVFTGDLLETFNSGGYTYVRLKAKDGDVWAAGPTTVIDKSDKVSFIGKVAMIDFYSKSLNRKFDNIYFVDSFIVNGERSNVVAMDPHKKLNKKQAGKLKAFDKASGGLDIADILKNRDGLKDKTVKVRGQVSKYTANVMGKNWLHVRDSSSDKDITVTTDAEAQLDDIVLIEGTLILNKDYGYGYVYDVLIEDAKATVE